MGQPRKEEPDLHHIYERNGGQGGPRHEGAPGLRDCGSEQAQERQQVSRPVARDRQLNGFNSNDDCDNGELVEVGTNI